MTPPDTNLQKEKRRHRGPLIGMAIVVVFAAGLILFWVAESFFYSPGPGPTERAGATEQSDAADIREGDIDVPSDARNETVSPGDPDVEVDQ